MRILAPSRYLGNEISQHRMFTEVLCIPILSVRLQSQVDEYCTLLSSWLLILFRASSTNSWEPSNVFTRVEDTFYRPSPRFENPAWDEEVKVSVSCFQHIFAWQ